MNSAAKELLRKYNGEVINCGSTNLLLGGEQTISPLKGVSCGTSAITVRVSTQSTCKLADKRRTLRIKGSSGHETPCSPPHIKNSLRCLAASAPRYVGKPFKSWGNEALRPETEKTS